MSSTRIRRQEAACVRRQLLEPGLSAKGPQTKGISPRAAFTPDGATLMNASTRKLRTLLELGPSLTCFVGDRTGALVRTLEGHTAEGRRGCIRFRWRDTGVMRQNADGPAFAFGMWRQESLVKVLLAVF